MVFSGWALGLGHRSLDEQGDRERHHANREELRAGRQTRVTESVLLSRRNERGESEGSRGPERCAGVEKAQLRRTALWSN